jgi:hypothetical protein
MTTIDIDEATRSKLEAKASERGLALADYLKWVAEGEPSLAVELDGARQEELREKMRARMREAKKLKPQPTKLLGTAGEFADALLEKYRAK